MTNDYLIPFLESLKDDVIHSMQANGKYATGQTAAQITIEDDGDKLQLLLPAYLQALEDGRAPTGSNATQGSPPMIERIKQWCQVKGIPDKAAWAIKKSIDKNGYNGTPGILSQPLGDDNINLRLNQITDQMATNIVQQIATLI
ncbi:MAG TPA: hypothetical protein VGM63_22680 [Mucilaginibacter sp.]|jgi:hypothetical protein